MSNASSVTATPTTPHLLLMPPGAGKTEYSLQQVVAVKQAKPLATVWVVLASERQVASFRRRLLGQPGIHDGFLNIRFFNPYTLNEHLLNTAGKPQRCLDDAARFALVGDVIASALEEQPENGYARIADTPGFRHVLADFLLELKQNLIEPAQFRQAATTPRLRDLAHFYDGYQRWLQANQLVDREGEGWLALEALDALPSLAAQVELLVIDGFDQFTVLQANLLTRLAARVRTALITLSRAEGAMGSRFALARTRLEQAYEAHTGSLLPIHPQSLPSAALPFGSLPFDKRQPSPSITSLSAEGINFIQAPDPASEVAAVLRRVKSLLLETGCAPDDILIAVRDWSRYSDALTTGAATYHLPLALHLGLPLASNPLVAALLNLLSLPLNDFRRRPLLDTLRSPYLDAPGLSPDIVDVIDAVSRKALVLGGRSDWWFALQAATVSAYFSPEHDDDEETTTPDIDPALASEALAALSRFFEACSHPASASLEIYLGWVEMLMGSHENDTPAYSLHIAARLSGNTDNMRFRELARRDRRAFAALNDVFAGLRGAERLLTAVRGRANEYSYSEFLTRLAAAINGASVDAAPNHAGHILVTTASDARGLPHPHVFILGLSEGIFPAPTPEDPLLLDHERAGLREWEVYLPLQAERGGEESVFLELAHLAGRTLTLSRPHTRDGVAWVESHLWRAMQEAFPNAPVAHYKAGQVIAAQEVCTPEEAALALAYGYANNTSDKEMAALFRWHTRDHAAIWSQIGDGHQVEMERLSNRPHDHYSGQLASAALKQYSAHLFSDDYPWSASQLNELGTCGFRFFSKRLLGLAQASEPEDGLDARTLGHIMHDILEGTYRQIGEANFAITPENLDFALHFLYQSADATFASAPQRFGFRPSALWQEESATLLARLERLVRADFSDDSPSRKLHLHSGERVPYQLERAFSSAEDGVTMTAHGYTLHVYGRIDRIDRIMSDDGRQTFVLIDYKSGQGVHHHEITRGRDFQLALYLLAGETMLGDAGEVVGGGYWSVSGNTMRTMLTPSDETMRQLQERAVESVLRARNGDFAARANGTDEGRCARYCEYHEFCRMSVTHRSKRLAQ